MAHRNLEAELARKNISKRDFAKHLQIDYSTLFRKLAGQSPFTIAEAFKTIRLLETDTTAIEYLFESATDKPA